MIRLDSVHKQYGDQKVLDGMSLEIQDGSVTTIIGRSGGGKSVLMRHMIGLERPDSGAIYVDGQNIVNMKGLELNRMRRRFGVLFQEAALFDSLSVKDNVAFPLREHLKVSETRIAEIVEAKLAEVGMGQHKNKFPGELSGGMKKRVGLARALALDPDVVFFDEPTSGLDPITKGVIFRLIAATHRERMNTYVLVSHDIQGVLRISDEVMMLFNGKISTKGSPEEILNSSDAVIRQFITGSADGPITMD
ncbi:MAG TPA: ABC transporter ATP-binding protein [Desulfomonilaceae bacterium]|nr:ABC transporter ATP-binding protein [Desulfomonilaceae bacterium]